MVTKNLKVKTETEKVYRLVEEAKICKPANEKPKDKELPELDVAAELRSIITGNAYKPKEQPKGLNKTEKTFCACGERNPTQNGYCINCVQKLRQRYDELLEKLE
jgi:hypothetical protein